MHIECVVAPGHNIDENWKHLDLQGGKSWMVLHIPLGIVYDAQVKDDRIHLTAIAVFTKKEVQAILRESGTQ